MDELEQTRRLLADAPPPDRDRKARARTELLARARSEGEASTHGARPARRRVMVAAAAVGALVLAGGALTVGLLDGGGPTGNDDRGPDVALAQPCRGPEGSYEVRYPAGWHTAPDEGCSLFSPEPLEANVGPLLGTISIDVTPIAFERAADPAGARIVSSREVTVGGRPAVRQRRETTGEAGLPPGLDSYVYVVDLGDATLVAAALESEQVTLDELRPRLDAMVATFRFAGS